jgi:serine/threonine protein kinase
LGVSFTMAIQPGTVINERWVVLEAIGKGGMGEVYLAHQLNLNRNVAIKVTSREWFESLEMDEEEIEASLQRFRREVRAMARIRHPNVVQIFDYGSASVRREGEEVPFEYLVMEYIPGSTLRDAMPEEGFHPDDNAMRGWLTEYFPPVLEGVRAMHDLGIVHRDLKPENVLLDGSTPKVADFGLARSRQLKSVSRSMDLRGTPPYMSPEQFFDFKGTDPRGDLYSLGKILFEAVSGRISPGTIPFRKAALTNPQTAFFRELDQVIQHATAEDREERIPSAEAFKKAMVEILDKKREAPLLPKRGRRKVPRRTRNLLFVLLVLAAGGIVGVGIHLALNIGREAKQSPQISAPEQGPGPPLSGGQSVSPPAHAAGGGWGHPARHTRWQGEAARRFRSECRGTGRSGNVLHG